jgi:VWFA-related protein
MRKFTLVAAIAAIALSLYARNDGAGRPVIPRAGDSIEVSIINVDVVVTDRKGNHVHGLTKDDFEIYESRKLQPVSNFTEYASGREAIASAVGASVPTRPAPEMATRPRRTIVVFLDHFSLLPYEKEFFFGSLKTLLHETIGPGDVVSIVSWKRMIVTRLPFTNDLAAFDAALDKIDQESTFLSPDPNAQIEGDRRWREEAVSLARSKGFNLNYGDIESDSGADVAMFEKIEMRRKVNAIQTLVTAISGFEGRKVLILAATHFSRIAGSYESQSRVAAGFGGNYDMFGSIESLGQIAATNNVTIYPLFPPGLAKDMKSAEDRRPLDRGAEASARLSNVIDAMTPIAERTGGVVSFGPKSIAEFLPQVRDDLDSYYSLAYRATASGSGADRSLVVKMKNRDYVARARRDYVDKSPETKMKDRVIASLFREPAGATISIAVSADAAKKQSKHHWSVPVHVEIPIASLTTLPGNGEHAGAFSVYVAWGGVLGELSEATRQTQSFRISDAKAAASKDGHFSYDLTLDVDERTQHVVIGVADDVSQEFGIRKIELPPRA